MSTPPDARGVRHAYVHFPFCARKCPYCDFNSHAGREAEIDAYLEALSVEAGRCFAGDGVATLYVGGGTPTHCDAVQLERYLTGLRDAAGGSSPVEFTVEANPGSLDPQKVGALVRSGVNRVSVGVQSLHDRHLQTLGRIHDARSAREAVDLLHDGGIEHVSVDLILAVPGQTLAEQDADLTQLVALGPEHVSAYVLTIEPETAFGRLLEAGRMAPPDGDRELEHLRLATSHLAAAGLERYEISNYARPGRPCLHNLAYWEDRDWIGLGAGAHSHQGAARWKNVDDPRVYASRIGAGRHAWAWHETAPPEVGLFEALLMGLRLTKGVDVRDLRQRHGLDVRDVYADELETHRRQGLLELDGARLRATERGLELLSFVLRDLVPDVRCRVEHFDD